MPRFLIHHRHEPHECGVAGRLHRPPETGSVRELAYRVSDRIHVRLLWHPAGDTVSVSVDDERTGEHFELPVKREKAMFAFNHPFAYAG